jgi:hypothetical protein
VRPEELLTINGIFAMLVGVALTLLAAAVYFKVTADY